MALIPNMNTYATNRLLIYIGISLFTAVQNELLRIQSGEFSLTGWVDYGIFSISIILPPLIVLRAFMDNALNEQKEK